LSWIERTTSNRRAEAYSKTPNLAENYVNAPECLFNVQVTLPLFRTSQRGRHNSERQRDDQRALPLFRHAEPRKRHAGDLQQLPGTNKETVTGSLTLVRIGGK
jgi:hypothetical protein